MSVCKKNAFGMYINHCANIYISKIVANEDLEEAYLKSCTGDLILRLV